MIMSTECLICGSNNSKSFCILERYEYMRCKSCGLIYLNNPASSEVMFGAYLGTGFKKFRRKLLTRFRHFNGFKDFEFHLSRGAKVTTLAAKYLDNDSLEHVNFLDIGCNKGFVLANAVGRGWNTHGIELVYEVIAPFKRDYPEISKQIHVGRIEDNYNSIKKEFFDCISAIDVVEHFENLIENFKFLLNLLKPGGFLIIQTPNSESENAKKMGCTWDELKPLEHLYIFNEANLKRLLTEIGFSRFEKIPVFSEGSGNLAMIAWK